MKSLVSLIVSWSVLISQVSSLAKAQAQPQVQAQPQAQIQPQPQVQTQTRFQIPKQTTQVLDLDPANKTSIQVENLNSSLIRFRWCEARLDGSINCETPIGCRGKSPFTVDELNSKRVKKRWAAAGIVGIDIAVLIATIAGGWAIFGGGGAAAAGAGAAGTAATGTTAVTTGAAGTLATTLPAGTILAADGTILSTAVATAPEVAAPGTALIAEAAKDLMLIQRLSKWSFLGISFTGLLMKFTKKLDPTTKFHEASTIRASIWQDQKNDFYDLTEYRKALHKVLCEIDGYTQN